MDKPSVLKIKVKADIERRLDNLEKRLDHFMDKELDSFLDDHVYIFRYPLKAFVWGLDKYAKLELKINPNSNKAKEAEELLKDGMEILADIERVGYLREIFSNAKVKVHCPVDNCTKKSELGEVSIVTMIMHINDHHKKSFSAIADWLDTLPYEFKLKTEVKSDDLERLVK